MVFVLPKLYAECITKIKRIIELLRVKRDYAFLPQLCASEVDCGIEHNCLFSYHRLMLFSLVYDANDVSCTSAGTTSCPTRF